jgi:F-type H+-transporting ATPase subunit b
MDLIFPDETLFIQMGIFIFLVIFLAKVLFKPILQVLEAREEMHLGPAQEAKRLKGEAATLKEEVGAAIASAKEEADKLRNEALSDARKSEGEMLAASRQEAEQFLTTSRTDMEKQIEEAAGQLQSDAARIGSALATKLLP